MHINAITGNKITASEQNGKIIAATKGDPEAMAIVVKHYESYITSLSMRKLYDERGNVYWGIDEDMSAVFQRFQKYKMSIEDNVIISAHTLDDREGTAFRQCMDKFDMELNKEKFADGYDTMLSRDFGGTEPSGGQWQRIAIIRGIYRDRNIMILDEPTSAIDPLEETKLYEKFAEMAQGRTALIVTHRIGLTKVADRIMVMDQGKLVQMGTYGELEAVDGKFRELLQAQKKWYTHSWEEK